MLLGEFVQVLRRHVKQFESHARQRHVETPKLVPIDRSEAEWSRLALHYLNSVAVKRGGAVSDSSWIERDAQLYQLFLAGKTYQQLADIFGLKRNSVGNCIYRHKERHGIKGKLPLGARPAWARKWDEREDIESIEIPDRGKELGRCSFCHLLLPCDPCPKNTDIAEHALRRMVP